MSTYSIKLNDHTARHADYESASTAWQRVANAVEDGRSIVAELWRHERYDWDDGFYRGLINIDGTVPEGLIAVKGQCIISRQCIARLDYP